MNIDKAANFLKSTWNLVMFFILSLQLMVARILTTLFMDKVYTDKTKIRKGIGHDWSDYKRNQQMSNNGCTHLILPESIEIAMGLHNLN